MNTLGFVASLVVVALTMSFLVAWDSESKFGENLRNETRALFFFPIITLQLVAGLVATGVARVLAHRSPRAKDYLTWRSHEPRHLVRKETHVEVATA